MSTFVLVAAVLVALIASFLGWGMIRPAQAQEPTEKRSHRSGAPSSRQEIERRLELLAATPVERELSVGAKCYKQAAPPLSADYVCPVCGERTTYDRQQAKLIETELPAARRLVTQLNELGHVELRLDELAFCEHCRPEPSDDAASTKKLSRQPALALEIQYPGDSTSHRCASVRLEDLRLLQEFFSGADVHTGSYGRETELRAHLERLEQLLGVELAKDQE